MFAKNTAELQRAAFSAQASWRVSLTSCIKHRTRSNCINGRSGSPLNPSSLVTHSGVGTPITKLQDCNLVDWRMVIARWQTSLPVYHTLCRFVTPRCFEVRCQKVLWNPARLLCKTHVLARPPNCARFHHLAAIEAQYTQPDPARLEMTEKPNSCGSTWLCVVTKIPTHAPVPLWARWRYATRCVSLSVLAGSKHRAVITSASSHKEIGVSSTPTNNYKLD